MSKIRSMSAGRSGAITYGSNVNGNQGGGDKKGGLASTTNKRVQYVIPAIRSRAYSNPDQRKMIFCVNQLGGVGAPSKMFAPTADGSCASCSREAKAHNFVILAYRQLLCRGVDENGLRKYTKQILNDPKGLCLGMKQVKHDLIISPEGRKCLSKLGKEEVEKRLDIVDNYINDNSDCPPKKDHTIKTKMILSQTQAGSYFYELKKQDGTPMRGTETKVTKNDVMYIDISSPVFAKGHFEQENNDPTLKDYSASPKPYFSSGNLYTTGFGNEAVQHAAGIFIYGTPGKSGAYIIIDFSITFNHPNVKQALADSNAYMTLKFGKDRTDFLDEAVPFSSGTDLFRGHLCDVDDECIFITLVN